MESKSLRYGTKEAGQRHRVVMALDNSANLHALTRTSDSIWLVRQSNILWRVLVKAYDRSASKQLQLAMDQPRLDEDTFCQSIRILTASAQGRRSPNWVGQKTTVYSLG